MFEISLITLVKAPKRFFSATQKLVINESRYKRIKKIYTCGKKGHKDEIWNGLDHRVR